jgi:hypothetical protein
MREGTNLVGQTNSSLAFNHVSVADDGTYCVIVSGACNSLTNCARLIVLSPVDPMCDLTGSAQSSEGQTLPILRLELDGHDVVLRFSTDPNTKYRVEYKDDLSQGQWRTAVDNASANGSIMPVRHRDGAGQPHRFYRVIVLP